jgi:hypothetical protein
MNGNQSIELAENNVALWQEIKYSALKIPIEKNQAFKRVELLLKKRVYHEKGLHPRKFCRRWFGMEDRDDYGRQRYTEPQILAVESEYGYREKCINLIATVLKLKPNTIQRWGRGVDFDNIPLSKREEYELYLGYVDTIRIMTLIVTRFNEDFLLELLHRSVHN